MEGRRLRSQVPPEEKIKAIAEKEKMEKLKEVVKPFITYKGNITYATTFIDCALACDELLSLANKSEDLLVLGFDLEWPFDFVHGSGKTALIQISPNLEQCYLLHVSQLKCLPKTLSELLIHPKVRIVGVNIKNDVRKLARDFVGFDGDTIIERCIDSGVFANSVLPIKQRWSMAKLVDYVLNMRINKSKSVRNSKWHIIPLNQAQRKYAATDAYASLKLHLNLVALEAEKEQLGQK